MRAPGLTVDQLIVGLGKMSADGHGGKYVMADSEGGHISGYVMAVDLAGDIVSIVDETTAEARKRGEPFDDFIAGATKIRATGGAT